MSVVTFHCPRCPLGPDPPGEAIELPCTGRVTPGLLLEAIVAGADGVLVMGRHQDTCVFREGDDRARAAVRQARAALQLADLGDFPLRFRTPPAGLEAPRRCLDSFVAELDATERRCGLPSPPPHHALPDGRADRALALGWWLVTRGARPTSAVSPAERGETPDIAAPGVELDCAQVALLDLLCSSWTAPHRVGAVAGLAARLCESLGVAVSHRGTESASEAAGPGTRAGSSAHAQPDRSKSPRRLVVGGWQPPSLPGDLRPAAGPAFEAWLVQHLDALKLPPLPSIVAADPSDKLAAELLAALAERAPLKVHWLRLRSPDGTNRPVPRGLALGQRERTQLEQAVLRAQADGASQIVVADPLLFVQLAILLRRGSWQRTLMQVTPALQLLLPGEATP